MRVIFFIIFLIYTCSSVENKTQESERVKQETLFGRQIVKNFLIRYHLLHDRESTIALNSLVRKVAAFTSRNDLYYRAGILDTDDVFAFSIPGGYILISRGMIKTWDSIESAEFVLAHELTHISLSHSFQPENNNSFEKFLQAGLDPTGGISVAANEFEKKWDTMLQETGREPAQEFESDISAGYILIELGCNPLSALSYLEKMEKLTKRTDWIQKTHPSFKDRVQVIQREFKNKSRKTNSCIGKEDWEKLNANFKK